MVDNKKLEELKFILWKRSEFHLRDAVIHYFDYITVPESHIYDKEIDYLAEFLGVKIELPF